MHTALTNDSTLFFEHGVFGILFATAHQAFFKTFITFHFSSVKPVGAEEFKLPFVHVKHLAGAFLFPINAMKIFVNTVAAPIVGMSHDAHRLHRQILGKKLRTRRLPAGDLLQLLTYHPRCRPLFSLQLPFDLGRNNIIITHYPVPPISSSQWRRPPQTPHPLPSTVTAIPAEAAQTPFLPRWQ